MKFVLTALIFCLNWAVIATMIFWGGFLVLYCFIKDLIDGQRWVRSVATGKSFFWS